MDQVILNEIKEKLLEKSLTDIDKKEISNYEKNLTEKEIADLDKITDIYFRKGVLVGIDLITFMGK